VSGLEKQYQAALPFPLLPTSFYKMKHLKLIFCLCLSLYSSRACTGQTSQGPYYWSSGHAIPLTESPFFITAELNENIAIDSFLENLLSRADVESVEKLEYRNQILIKLTTTASSELYSDLQHNENVLYVAHCFTDDPNAVRPLIPSREILLELPENGNMEHVLENMGGEAVLYTETSYGTYVLQVQKPASVLEVANRIYESGKVEWCHPNFIIQLVHSQQNDLLYSSQYYLDNNLDVDINASEAWGISKGVSKVRVAVIDEGVALHEDLEETVNGITSSRVKTGYDSSNPNNPGYPDYTYLPPLDQVNYSLNVAHSHGEAVAGIIAASHNSLGIAGVAPCSDIVPINTFTRIGNSTVGDMANSFEWAWSQDPGKGHADVINNSWNYPINCNAPVPISYDALTRAIHRAATLGRQGKGCPIFFSAGNLNDLPVFPPSTDYPNGISWRCVSYPASLPDVIAIGAVSQSGVRSSYSNYGPGSELDLVAPSAASTGDVVTLDLMGPLGVNTAANGHYQTHFGGTSAAAPQAAGAAALMLSINPNLTAQEVRDRLQNTATDMGVTGYDNEYGHGRLNVEAALRAAAPITALPILSGPTSENIDYGSTYTFSIPPQPIGTTYNWSITPAIGWSFSQGTAATFTTTSMIAYTYRTEGEAKVTITGPCGTAVLTKKIVYPGIAPRPGSSPRQTTKLKAYPNPANTTLVLELADEGTNAKSYQPIKIDLIDMYGQLRLTVNKTEKTVNLPVEALPSGIYSLRVTVAGEISTQRIAIKH
jgi:serine protease